MKLSKRLLALLLALLLCCTALGCGQTAAQTDTRSFTDSCGRTVTIPTHIDHIAASGSLAQIILFALAPDKLAGVSNEWSEDALPYIDASYQQLPVLGQLYGGKGELNQESLLASGAQIVIDIGEAKDSIVSDMDGLQEQTGLPFVHIDASLATLDETYQMLGDLLGLEDDAAVLSDYCRSVYDRAANIASTVDKVDLLYLLPENHVIAQGSYHSEVIDLLSNNVAVVDNPSSKGTGNEVDAEQLLLWNPDYILFAPDALPDDLTGIWQQMRAVQDGHYCQVPGAPYNWMGFPPSAQRLLGLIWMPAVLYPDACTYDLHTEIAQYYHLFYHVELTDTQIDQLLLGCTMP